ncbi:CheY-like chemotaxis protein [Endobacter medicaginis]|uniref:CheY-like chemotaxis protein n=2 Tax=Endobacter medicaginis TaxID=1181271 RepID=A0A839UUT2_9PROT|nr:response regulator [Endobacter medicaginis]MBB3173526.1 CheY-like chemotaxis protein [Endobacter medicaginis]MCX5475385.1 response regulator [Endobacter medicaginis]
MTSPDPPNMPPAAAIVLVVEDETLLRMHSVDFIEAAGYRVLEAADTDTAIAVLEANPAIRVVLTDVDLPGSMDGLKLAAAIRRRWPPIELIVTSGAVTPQPGDLPERSIFVPKPVDPRRVLSAIDGFIGLD